MANLNLNKETLCRLTPESQGDQDSQAKADLTTTTTDGDPTHDLPEQTLGEALRTETPSPS